MGWRTVSAVLVVVFVIGVLQAVLAGPLITLTDDVKDTGDFSNEHFDAEQIIDNTRSAWFNMGLVAIFGIMAWGMIRVVRRELTRGGQP